MARFNLERKGYNKKEVDDYIGKTVSYLEAKINDQNERIKQLKEETDFLYKKTDEYRRNEEKVSSALIKVMDIRHNTELEMYERNELELERLKLFREKWLSYALEVQKSECEGIIDSLNRYMDGFTAEFNASVKTDLNIRPAPQKRNEAESEYFKEKERISGLMQSELNAEINDEEGEKLVRMCKNLGLLDE